MVQNAILQNSNFVGITIVLNIGFSVKLYYFSKIIFSFILIRLNYLCLLRSETFHFHKFTSVSMSMICYLIFSSRHSIVLVSQSYVDEVDTSTLLSGKKLKFG